MKISFENFAKAGTGEITVNDLTVICGPNNTGKTFLNYGVFSIIENMMEHFRVDIPEEMIRQASKELIENDVAELKLENLEEMLLTSIESTGIGIASEFHSYLKAPKEHFKNLKIRLDFDDINDIRAEAPHGFFYRISKEERISGEYIHEEKKIIFTVEYGDIQNGNGNEKSKLNTKNDVDYYEFITKLIQSALYYVFIFPKISVPFPVTSERTGVSLFHKIFDFYNNRIVSKIEENVNKSIGEELTSKHAIPIQHNIDRIRFFENVIDDDSFIIKESEKHQDIIDLHSEFIYGGRFQVENGVITFHPSEVADEPAIQLHLASSSLKAHLLFDIFIRNIAQRNHMLFIDEPELNLYPANQAKMARLIAKLVNAGVKVMVTTHSDFFIREINNLITLGSIKDIDLRNEVMNDFGINENDILDFSRVAGYMTTTKREIKKMEVDEGGINTEVLNSVILDENEKSNIIVELLERESENE